MSAIAFTLSHIIHGQKDICCLCLNSIQEVPIRLSDDVVIDLNNENCDTAVEEVLNFVFDDKMYKYITTFDTICEQCMKQAISYYKFIKLSQKNAEHLEYVVKEITYSFEYTRDTGKDTQSLFVSLNLSDFTSKHYYDVKHTPYTTKGVLKRFNSLDKIKKTRMEDNQLLENQRKDNDFDSNERKRSKKSNKILFSDFLDKNSKQSLNCKQCFKEFPTLWSLKNHFIRVHAPKTFKCSECSKSYGSSVFLEEHKNQSHCTVICSECGKTFSNRHTLKNHEIGHDLTLVCQDCGRIYKNRATYKKHIEQNVCGQKTRAHPSEAKYTCDYCNKKYTQKMSLRVHIQYEHGNYKSHICEWCGKKFWAQSRLKAHIVKHTKEKNFQCKICCGKFVSKESLLYHTRTHTGERPYKCPHCEYRFLSASRRSEHVKRHHLGGTLECDICHSKFTSRRFLQKHKRTHIKHEKINLTYDILKTNVHKQNNVKTNVPKQNNAHHSKSILTKSNLNADSTSRDTWKMEDIWKREEVGMQSFQNVFESADVQIQNFDHEMYEDRTQQSEDRKVYLEVSDDDEFIKIVGI